MTTRRELLAYDLLTLKDGCGGALLLRALLFDEAGVVEDGDVRLYRPCHRGSTNSVEVESQHSAWMNEPLT